MTLTVVCGQTKLHIFDEEAKLTLCGLKFHESFFRCARDMVLGSEDWNRENPPPGSWGPVKMCRKCFPGGKG